MLPAGARIFLYSRLTFIRPVCCSAAVPKMSFAAEDFAELDAVLHADIPWESYMTARLITERDLSLIRRFDKKSDEVKQSILDEVRRFPICDNYTSLFSACIVAAAKHHARQTSAVRPAIGGGLHRPVPVHQPPSSAVGARYTTLYTLFTKQLQRAAATGLPGCWLTVLCIL